MRLLLTLLLATSPLLAACGAVPAEGSGGGAPTPEPQEVRPWMPYFVAPQSLIADEVRVEGPDGLLEHVALGHEPELHVYTTETTPDGLLQVVELRPGMDPMEEPIRVQVDSLDMRVLKRVVVLERVGQPPLRIEARGQAWWAREDGQGELRAERLVLPDDLPSPIEASAGELFDEYR